MSLKLPNSINSTKLHVVHCLSFSSLLSLSLSPLSLPPLSLSLPPSLSPSLSSVLFSSPKIHQILNPLKLTTWYSFSITSSSFTPQLSPLMITLAMRCCGEVSVLDTSHSLTSVISWTDGSHNWRGSSLNNKIQF